MAMTPIAGTAEIKIDDSGSTQRNMSAYVTSISDLGKEITALDVTTFADSAERVLAGIEISQEFSITGPFDDTATSGPDAVFGTLVGVIADFEWHPKGTASGKRKISGKALCTSYKPTGEVKGLATYTTTFKVDGAVTIAAN